MNDLEFARRVSPHIGELYAEAKRSHRLFPAHTLTRTRGLASLCCDILRDEAVTNWPDGLEDRVGVLVRTRRINDETRTLLHKLRRLGNVGAHPEQFRLGTAELAERAGTALETSRALLEIVFRQQHIGATVPDYDVVDDDVEELKDVCYRALIEDSAVDQYQVAMMLRRQLATQVAEAEASEDPTLTAYMKQFEFKALEDRALDLLRYASDDGHAPARYAYGLALTEDLRGEEMVAYGANLIAMACRDGNSDSQAWYGHAALYGLHDEPIDYERARNLLELAAAEDHPLALSLLSTIHRSGLGVPADPRLAFELTLRAAQAGYPASQYEAAAALFDGVGVERDEQAAFVWLQQASKAGQPEALLAQARLVRRGSLPGGADEAERLLLGAMQRINEARFELAELYMTQDDPRKWLAAVSLIQAAYELALNDKDSALADRCRAVSPGWIAKLDRILRNGGHTALSGEELNSVVITRFMFDDYGRPYPNRQGRMREFYEKAMAVARAPGGEREQERLLRKLASGVGRGSASAGAIRRTVPPPPVTRRVAQKKVSRNEPCQCGSGRKFKLCCGFG